VHDGSFEEEVMKIKQAMRGMLTPPESVYGSDSTHSKHDKQQEEPFELMDLTMTVVTPQRPTFSAQRNASHDEAMQDMSPKQKSAADHPISHSHFAMPTASSLAHAAPEPEHEEEQQPAPETPQHPHPFRTTTTTTTIPLADHSSTPTTTASHNLVPSTPATNNLSSSQNQALPSQGRSDHPDFSAFHTPSGLTREAAIEQLRLRRGRAKSVVAPTASNLAVANASASNAHAGMTPMTTSKKGRLFDGSNGMSGAIAGSERSGMEMETPRREFSAPEMGTGKRMVGMRSVSRPASRVASK